MQLPATPELEPRRDDPVVQWRLTQLTRAGFEPVAAADLAGRLEIDLHGALDLVAGGCPPALAARILL